jgi:hypothetical protein
MAVIWVQIAKTASRAVGRTEPDVHLIKQVEQVTTSALERPTWRFAGILKVRRYPIFEEFTAVQKAVSRSRFDCLKIAHLA